MKTDAELVALLLAEARARRERVKHGFYGDGASNSELSAAYDAWEQANTALCIAVQERLDAAEEPATDPRVGYALFFDRDELGFIYDGLIELAESARRRKQQNRESTSDLRVDACHDLMRKILAADPMRRLDAEGQS
jgi:hypothetical protein